MAKRKPKSQSHTITITLRELIAAREALQSLLRLTVPAATAFRLAKVGRAVNAELQAFDEARRGLFERYGEEENGQWRVKEEYTADFRREMERLLGEGVTLEFPLLDAEDFGELTGETLMATWFLFALNDE